MTQWKTTTVGCPACFEEGIFRICTVMDMSENPELMDRLFSRDLFRFVCPHCGEEIIVSYDCTLTNTDKRKVIALISEGADESRLAAEDCTLRIVRTINELAEKAALFEDDIDDKVTEIYKIMLEDQYEEERPGAEILGIYYSGKSSDGKSINFYIITANAENCHASLSMDTYSAIEKQLAEECKRYPDECRINRDWALRVLQAGFDDQPQE